MPPASSAAQRPPDADDLNATWAGALVDSGGTATAQYGDEGPPDESAAAPYDMPHAPPPWGAPRPPRQANGVRRTPALAPPPESPYTWGPTTLTIGPNTAAGLSYLFWWISGLVVYFNERHNRFVRFHAVQSILLTSALTVFGVLAYIISNLLFDVSVNTHQRAFEHVGQGIGLLSFFVIVMLWLGPMIAAWSGSYLRLPIVGEYAERYAAIPLELPDDE